MTPEDAEYTRKAWCRNIIEVICIFAVIAVALLIIWNK